MKFAEAPTVQNVFAAELALIQDDDIREFVCNVFAELCPNYFWYIPASVKGHHPPVCRTAGGLVHHVKLAIAFADGFADMLSITDDMVHAQIIAAMLLHDMFKRGRTENELETWLDHRQANRDHGRYCADQIAEYLDSQQCSADKFDPIVTAVRLHMGRWTWEVTDLELAWLETDQVVRTTHLADYAASRALHQYLAERAMDTSMEYLKQ